MWKLYDSLIDQVEDDVVVSEMIVGLAWTAARSKSIGLAMSSRRPLSPSPLSGNCQGKTVKELAKRIKSWEFFEASIGLSAINSVLNNDEHILKMEQSGFRQLPAGSAFDLIAENAKGKKVAVIGHFRNMGKLAEQCELTILERKPTAGDLPDPAAEYILPEQDVVLLTSSTLINKTAPRLLELSKNAVTIMIGPSTPFSPVLFDMGVDIISGLIVEEEDRVLRCVQEGGGVRTFRNSIKYINMSRKGFSF
ncbi:DUF364 domain-containing protein [Bacillus sp. Bva_UNVM-123]|uniref:Rossmann-like domain-containing protein n=1 Tax=Bacillus sp. Bva_UNVM-123 TaxID=2829798 RepID=UPI00391FBBEB